MIRLAISTAAIWLAVSAAANAADSAVVLLYHRFGEPQQPSTNTPVADLEAHIAELKSGKYEILPLEEIISALRGGRTLPDWAVAITIDDAFSSVYETAWPMFKAADLPFTLFVSTKAVDDGLVGQMNWDQIRELQNAGVTIGHHSVAHGHMADMEPELFRDELAEASRRFMAELGEAPTLFAFPFGEASLEGSEIARKLGFAAAFGQHSGAMHASLDPFYLPRFSLTGSFSGLDRLKLVAGALPLPITGLSPGDPKLSTDSLNFAFNAVSELDGFDRLACFVSGYGEVPVRRNKMRFIVDEVTGLEPGRIRINCTAPAGNGRFRWLGMQYYRGK